MNPRCLTVFEQSCKSRRTFRDYKLNLDYFLKFYHKDYDSLLLLPQIELEESLQDYCIFLRRRVENNEIDEKLKLFCEQVSWLKAMYYKGRKCKRRHVTCPNCKTTSFCLVRKEKNLLNLECPNCLETYKDLFEEYF